MEPNFLYFKLEELKKIENLKSKVKELRNIILEFTDVIENADIGKKRAIKYLKYAVYVIRIDLAFNKATESNTGNLDKELDELVKLNDWLNTLPARDHGKESKDEIILPPDSQN